MVRKASGNYTWPGWFRGDVRVEGSEDVDKKGLTIWSIFPRDTKYLGSSNSALMINYRVDDLDALLKALETEGVQIDPHREDAEYGRFAWITDPDGTRIELWEPPKK
jgi:catechol 2,3-dioxygenase-like lactoylglutathione lyase family enzyme